MASLLLGLKIPYCSSTFEPVEALKGNVSLDQASKLVPQGVYTSFRTYHGKYALHLADHFSRLEESARLLGVSLDLEPAKIRAILRENLLALDGEEFRIRLSVDLEGEIGSVYVFIERLVIPGVSAYQKGVNILLRPFLRENPRVKSTRFIQDSVNYRRLITKEINEVLLFNSNGDILEGLSSNFYAVVGDKILTAGEGILPGITRKIVLEEAIAHHLGLEMRPAQINDLLQLQEAFLTSSSRAVLPIRKIENTRISSGLPGPLTESISKFFQARVESEIEEI